MDGTKENGKVLKYELAIITGVRVSLMGRTVMVGKAFEFVVDYFSCIAAKRLKTEARSLQGRTRAYKCWHLIMEE